MRRKRRLRLLAAGVLLVAGAALVVGALVYEPMPALSPPEPETRLAHGPAALAIAFALLDRPIDNDEFRAIDSGEGVTLTELRDFALRHGLTAEIHEMSAERLAKVRHIGVTELQIPFKDDREPHFGVHAGPAPEGKVYYINPNPMYGRGAVSVEALARKYTGRVLLLSPGPIELPVEEEVAGAE